MDLGVIEVETKCFFLSMIYLFNKPMVAIDGYPPQQQPWGVVSFQVPPGPHDVRVFIPWLIPTCMGDNIALVNILPGRTVRVEWRPPKSSISPGKMKVFPPEAWMVRQPGPPGWGTVPPDGGHYG
jgi:hypothetical protein